MPQIRTNVDFSNIKSIDELVRFLSPFINNLQSVINGNLEFTSNFKAILLDTKFSTANLNTGIAHTLGRVPLGYINVGSNVATQLYDGSSPNSADFIFLRSTVVSNVKLLIF